MRPRELVVAWVEAFNRGDPDEMATFYAEHAVNHQVVREPMEGRAAIREMFAKDFASAKMVCIAEHIFEDGPSSYRPYLCSMANLLCFEAKAVLTAWPSRRGFAGFHSK
jgi:hypothetical protein